MNIFWKKHDVNSRVCYSQVEVNLKCKNSNARGTTPAIIAIKFSVATGFKVSALAR